jgi:hypothetical protein
MSNPEKKECTCIPHLEITCNSCFSSRPRLEHCKQNCPNLYWCTFTCHHCNKQISNKNRCSEHDNLETPFAIALECEKCVALRKRNVCCKNHTQPSAECQQCVKKIKKFKNNPCTVVHVQGSPCTFDLSFCDTCFDLEIHRCDYLEYE